MCVSLYPTSGYIAMCFFAVCVIHPYRYLVVRTSVLYLLSQNCVLVCVCVCACACVRVCVAMCMCSVL